MYKFVIFLVGNVCLCKNSIELVWESNIFGEEIYHLSLNTESRLESIHKNINRKLLITHHKHKNTYFLSLVQHVVNASVSLTQEFIFTICFVTIANP